jgi:hypothetical protein
MDPQNPGQVQWVNVVCQKQKDYVPFPPFRLALESVETDEGKTGPVLLLPANDVPVDGGGKRTAAMRRKVEIAGAVVAAVAADPGLSWRKLRDGIPGKNTEKAIVRDQLIEQEILEYDEASGGYYLGSQELDFSEWGTTPPLLGYEERNQDG